MTKSTAIWVGFLCLIFSELGYAQCFNGDPSANYASWNFSATVEANFNAARRLEETDLGLTPNCLGNMVAPSGGWASYTDEEIALYIHNSERTARGFLPLYGVESNLSNVAVAHSNWQMANDVFSHTGDPSIGTNAFYTYTLCADCNSGIIGSSPFQRIDQSAPLQGQWQQAAENLAVRVTSGSTISDFVAKGMYSFMYLDAGSLWGHRHGILTVFIDNWGESGNEGFIGVGVAEDFSYQACLLGCGVWNFAKILTVNYYDPFGSASGFSFSVLPVELLSFTAQEAKENVLLKWSTLSEDNSDYFDVQRSADGIHFETIGEVSAAGYSSEIRHYSLSDNPPKSGVWYYRLKEIDFDGQSQLSHIESVSMQPNIDFTTYPNPFIDKFTISLSNNDKNEASFDLINAKGQTILTGRWLADKDFSEKTIQLNDYPAGVYFLKIKIGTEQQIKRIVKL